MAASKENFYKIFYKKSYPAIKFREDPVHPSNGMDSFQYGRPATKNVPAFYEYFAPRLQHLDSAEDTMDSWEDGIYTWVLLNTNDFFAIRTLTAQETGTLHENILKYIAYQYADEFPEPKDQFVASGELYLKSDANSGYRRIFFNFESGTFLKLVLSGKTEKQQAALQKKLVSRIESLLEMFCPAGCIIQPILGTSFFSLFHLYTPPSILSKINTFLSRNPPKQNHSSFNNDKKPGTLYVLNDSNKRETKKRKIKGNYKGTKKNQNQNQNQKKAIRSLSPKKKLNQSTHKKSSPHPDTKKKSLSMKKKSLSMKKK
jgi:hypothetical protein